MLVRIVHILTRPILYPLFWFFLRFKAVDTKNWRKVKGPAIFVSNHESYFDPLLISAGIPWYSHFHAIHFLAHDNLFEKNKFTRTLLKIYGSFPGRAYKGDESAYKTPAKLLSEGRSIGIFKEWCYKTNPGRGYVSKMISAISIKNNVPIIPVFTYGIYDGGITWSIFFKRKRAIRVVYGEPIYPEKDSSEEKINNLIEKSFLQTKLAFVRSLHEEEKGFWNNYARFYHYIERVSSYKDLLREIKLMLPEHISGKWMDLGSGSGEIVEILVQKADKNKTEISSSDIDQLMLDKISSRFADEKIVKIRQMDLSQPMDLISSYFDGITANLVLPYIVHHRGEIGKKSLIYLLDDIYKALKPGGVFLWSTPKHNVNFINVSIDSWRDLFSPKHLENIYYGPVILRQAIRIQKKGVFGVYSFLKPKEIKEILEKIGFTEISFKRSMANQVDIVVCKKP